MAAQKNSPTDPATRHARRRPWALIATIAALGTGLGLPAHAETVDDLLGTLKEKGILSPDEYRTLENARADEKKQQKSEAPHALKINDAIRSAELFGDLRLRYEDRAATDPNNASFNRQRWRYSLRVGVRGDVNDDFFYGFRLDTSTYGRSGWNTFADDNGGQGGKSAQANKSNDGLSVGLVYLGWRATDWLTVIAGRQANPLYTTHMVWDGDITPEGLSQSAKFKVNDNLTAFATAGQFIYQDFSKPSSTDSSLSIGRQNLMLYAFEVGAGYKLSEKSSLKAAVNYYTYAGGQGTTGFRETFTGTAGTGGAGMFGINDLRVLEIPAEFRFPLSSLSGVVFGDFAKNLKGNDRAINAGFPNQTDQDKAMQIGFSVGTYGGSAKKGAWNVKTYWQRIEQFALDPNMIDSDIFERTNMQGIFLSASYSPADRIVTTFTFGHASRYNSNLTTGGYNDDSASVGSTIDKLKLMQFDVALKF
ncbi:MAG: hypothetical protein GC151_12340 [Betaproteobacteria bacterium]|nr:hypothetical protein [Betaproteobacteria bacterium]